jgi:hypothetical protein
MTDVLERAASPSAVERAMEIFEKFKGRDRAEPVQARIALTDYVFGLVAAGETDGADAAAARASDAEVEDELRALARAYRSQAEVLKRKKDQETKPARPKKGPARKRHKPSK